MANLGISVSADAKQASATFKDLAADIKSVGKESVGVTEGVAKVGAALDKLKNAPDTPMALARATAKVKLEVDELRAALEKTPASAEKMKAISAALAQADAAMEKSISRAGKLGEAQEEVKQKMGLTAKGAESLGNSFNSLDGIMGKMADSSSGAAQSIAKVGFSMMAAVTAFNFGYDAGTKFNKFLQEHGNILEKVIDLQIREIDGLGSMKDLLSALPVAMNSALQAKQQLARETAATLDALEKEAGGWKDLDKVRAEAMQRATDISKRYNQLRADGKEWRGEMEQQAGSIKATTEILQRLGVQFKDMPLGFEMAAKHVAEFELRLTAAANAAALTGDGIRGLSDTLAQLPANLKNFNLTEVIDGLAKAIASARDSGEGWDVILSDYSRELAALAAAARRAGDEGLTQFREKILDLIPAHQAATIAVSDQAKATAKAMAEIVAAYDMAAAAAEKSRARESAARNFALPETTQELQRIQFEAVGAAAAAGEFGTSLDTVAKKVVGLNGTLTVQRQIWLEVAMASDEATAALYRQVEATRALSDQQKESLDAARGWSDYIIALKEGYESGVTSLGSYIQQLIAFKSQLEQMFAGVTGAAADSLNEMIQLIETLLATAGAGGPTSRGGGYAGQFQRDMDKKGKK